MATWKPNSDKMKSSFWLGFKSNIIAGIVLILFSGLSVVFADFFYKESSGETKRIGVTTRDNRKAQYPDFDYYVIQNYQRNREYEKAHQIIKKLPVVYSHRLRLSDWKEFMDNKRFFLDDWWLKNCKFWYREEWDYPLRQTLKLLPKGTEIIINEHRFNSMERLIAYTKLLEKDYPNLKFSIGIQIHLQWLDPAFFRKLYIINRIEQSELNWMISEYSMMDKIYKQKIGAADRFIPDIVRKSLAAHQSFWIASQCGQSKQCQGMTLWVPNGKWMIDKLPASYDGDFLIWHRDTQEPSQLYWAIRKGLKY